MSLIQNIKNLDGIELSRDRDERIIRDNKWVEEINRGDKNAFEAMYKCYYPQLFHFLTRYFTSDILIEDTIHQVFYKIWQNRKKVEARGTLKSYLFTAVRNQALKQIEKEKRITNRTSEIHENSAVSINTPENLFEFKELNEAYQDAVTKLPEKRRHIFLMHRQDHLTYKEIAGVLNISVKTVETQISRSLKFLAESLSSYM